MHRSNQYGNGETTRKLAVGMERTDARDPFSALFQPLMFDEAEPPCIPSNNAYHSTILNYTLFYLTAWRSTPKMGKERDWETKKKKKHAEKRQTKQRVNWFNRSEGVKE